LLVKILKLIYAHKVSTISEIARVLNVDRSIIEHAIQTLLNGGYLAIDYQSVKSACPQPSISKFCALCPLKDSCNVYQTSAITFYQITEKGLALIKRSNE